MPNAVTVTAQQLHTLKQNLDPLLGRLETALETKAFAAKLPVVGAKLAQAFTQGQAALQSFLRLETAVTNAVDALDGTNADGTLAAVQAALDRAVQQSGFDGTVQLALDNGTLSVAFSNSKSDTWTQALDDGFGLPGIGLRTTGTASASLSTSLHLSASIDAAGNWVLQPSGSAILDAGLLVSTPQFSADAQLGALHFRAADDGTALSGHFAIGASGGVTFTGNANLGVRLFSDMGSAALPSVSATLAGTWGFNASTVDPGSNAAFGGTPHFEFDGVTFDFGTFFDTFVKPELDKIIPYLRPVQQALAILATDLSFIKTLLPGSAWKALDRAGAITNGVDAPDGKVTLLDLLKLASPGTNFVPLVQAAQTAQQIISLAAFLDGTDLGPQSYVLGDLKILGDVRDAAFNIAAAATQLVGTGQSAAQALASSAGSYGQAVAGTGNTAGKLLSALLTTATPSSGSSAQPFGLSLPVLTDPSSLLSFLGGGNADLLRVVLPTFSSVGFGSVDNRGEPSSTVDIGPAIPIPLPFLPPGVLSLQLSGAASVSAGISFGYDTSGLIAYAQGGFQNPALLGNSLWLANGLDGDVLQASAAIQADLQLGAFGFSLQGGGSLGASIDLGFNTPGKVYISQLAASLGTDPLSLLSANGQVSAAANVGINAFGRTVLSLTSPAATFLTFGTGHGNGGTGGTSAPATPTLLQSLDIASIDNAMTTTGTLGAGHTIRFVASFNNAVSVTGNPALSLNNGALATYDQAATNALGDPSQVVFRYTTGAFDTSVRTLTVTGWNSTGGSLRNAAGTTVTPVVAGTPFYGLNLEIYSRVTWIGPQDGHFGIAANWNSGQVPNAHSEVQIGAGKSVMVTQQETNEVDSLTLAAGGRIDITSGRFVVNNTMGTTVNNGEIDVESGVTSGYELFVTGGISNQGTIGLYGGTLHTFDTYFTLSGGGHVVMAGGAIGGRNPGASGFDTFVNVDNLIDGHGSIGNYGFNYGLNLLNGVNANIVAEAGTLVLHANTTNLGILGASDGGLLDITGDVDQSDGGRIVALGNGARVLLEGGTVTGGIVAGLSGAIEVAGNTVLDGVTILGGLTVDAHTKLTLTGDINADGATIDASAGSIDLRGAHVHGGTLVLPANTSADGLVLDAGGGTISIGSVTVEGRETLTLGGGIANSGTLTLAGSDGTGKATLRITGTTTLSGGGTVRLIDTYGNYQSLLGVITGGSAADVLDNRDNTITGYGELGNGALSFLNEASGQVIATSSTLRLWTGGGPVANQGTMTAAGGTLLIESTVDNTGGTIAANGSTVQFGGDGRAVTIVGGALTSSNGGRILVAGEGATLDGSTHQVTVYHGLDVAPGAGLTVAGQLNNQGNLGVYGSDGYGAASMTVSGAVTLLGGGTVTLIDTYSYYQSQVASIAGSSSADVLTNIDNTIQGYGLIGRGRMTLANAGTVDATEARLTVDTGIRAIVNTGLMEATAGGTLEISSNLTNSGRLYAGATSIAILHKTLTGTTGSTIEAANNGRLVLDGGTITGPGTLVTRATGTLEVATTGTLDGTSTTVALAGALAIDAGAILTAKGIIGNNGTISINGSYGYGPARLQVSGTVTLTAGGRVELIDTYSYYQSQIASISGTSTADVLDNRNNTIVGYGLIGQGKTTLVNEGGGIIKATNSTLTIDTGTTAISNAGLLAAEGGTLEIKSAVTNTGQMQARAGSALVLRNNVANTGTVSATDGATVVLDGVAFTGGGTLSTTATGTFEVASGAMLDGTVSTLTLAGTMLVDASATLRVKGAVANSGAIRLNGSAGSGTATLRVTGALALSGGGTVALQDTYSYYQSLRAVITGGSVTDVLDNTDNTITGYGELGLGSLGFINEASGKVVVTSSTMRLWTGGTVTNHGLLQANGGTLLIEDRVANADAIIEAAGSTVQLGGDGRAATIAGGTLRSSGVNGGVQIATEGATLDGSAQVVAANAAITVAPGTGLTLKGGIRSAGTITVNGSSGSGQASVNVSGTVLLSGGGTITMLDTYSNYHGQRATIAGSGIGDNFINADNTIQGYGTIGQGKTTLDNSSIIDATTGTLTIDTGAATINNSGLLEATAGGTLEITSNLVNHGTMLAAAASGITLHRLINNSGQIQVNDTGLFTLDGGTLSGTGSFTTAAGATLHATANGGYLSAVQGTVTLGGSTVIDSSSQLIATGSIVNTGQVMLNGSSGYGTATLRVAGTLTLSGGGTITLTDTYSNYRSQRSTIVGGGAAEQLINTDNTIQGYGTIGQGQLSLQNGGTIDATAATLTIDTGAATIANTGLLEATAGGTLEISSDMTSSGALLAATGSTVLLHRALDNTGRVQADAGGLLKLDGGAVGGTGHVTLAAGSTLQLTGAGGSLSGTQTLVNLNGSTVVDAGSLLTATGRIANAGAIALNGSSGYGTATMRVTGVLALSGGGTVALQDTYSYYQSLRAVITGGSATDVLDNTDNTITGYGELGLGSLGFINEASGKLVATSSTMRLWTGSTVTNRGLLQANGGTLLIEDRVDNAGASIEAVSSTVQLGGDGHAAAVVGGTLRSSGTDGRFVVASAGATLDGTAQQVALTGTLAVAPGTGLTLAGTLRNAGVVAIAGSSASGPANLRASGTATLTGGGRVFMLDTSGNYQGQQAVITGDSATAVLDNRDNTITGYGQLGAGALSFINEAAGKVVATASTLTLDTGANTVVNHGTLLADGGTLLVRSAVDNTGLIEAKSGTLTMTRAVGGALQVDAAATLDLQGGVLAGATLSFTGATGTATIAGGGSFAVQGFGAGDVLDFAGLSATGTYNNGVLSLSDGSRISFAGAAPTDLYSATSDGHGGTMVVRGTRPAPTHAIPNDLAGTGRSDLVWRRTDGLIVDWRMNGGTITAGSIVTALGLDWTSLGSGDLNGDGRTDLQWQRNSDGLIVNWQMDGGTIAAGSIVAVLPNNWAHLATADLDGDGKADMLWQDKTTGLIVDWTMNGGSVASGAIVAGLDSSYKFLASTDFDGDGKSDILWQRNDGLIVQWDMSGPSIIGAGIVGTLDSSWSFLAAADFDGDGKGDILWRNAGGLVVEWQMDGGTIKAGAALGVLDPADWRFVGTGDLNGDGRTDIQWQNASGLIVDWEMNGLQVAGGSLVGNLDSTWQHIG